MNKNHVTLDPMLYLLHFSSHAAGGRVPPSFIMSVEGPNQEPKHMASRQWSAETLKCGMDEVFTDVKREPWVDATDEELKERLEAGFMFRVHSHSFQSHHVKQLNLLKTCLFLDARPFEHNNNNNNKLRDLTPELLQRRTHIHKSVLFDE